MAAVGVIIIFVAILVIAGSSSQSPANGLWMFLFGLLTFYAGGGFLMLSVTRLPQPELWNEREAR